VGSPNVRGHVKPFRCPHCGIPHDPERSICPSTGLAIHRIPPAPAIPVGVAEDPVGDALQRRQLIGRVIGDKYGVTGLIGEGGMGAVYEAEHLAIGRLVAVKVLHPKHSQKKEAISRLQHEARVVGTIGHPNICEIYDMGRLDDGTPYLVMERLHGETLAERIQRDGAVPFQDLIDIIVQVLSALIAAHDKGIIHRDLKPDNIFLSQRPGMLPIAKLLDFGISKAQTVDDTAMHLTRTGMVMGTPYYMAPEQARGDRTLDQRVDLWAVGVILYEALTGRRPFLARNYNALLVQILTSRHRAVAELQPTIPGAVSQLVDKALSKMREDRYQSAAEFQEALVRLKRSLSPSSPAPKPTSLSSVADGQVLYGRRATDHRRDPAVPVLPAVSRSAAPAAPAAAAPLPRIDPTPPTPLPPIVVPAPVGVSDPASISESLPSGSQDDATFVLSGSDLLHESSTQPDAHADDDAPTYVSPRPVEEDNERTVVDPPSFLNDSATSLRRDTPKPRSNTNKKKK